MLKKLIFILLYFMTQENLYSKQKIEGHPEAQNRHSIN